MAIFDVSRIWHSRRPGDSDYTRCMIKVTQESGASTVAHQRAIEACKLIPGVSEIKETINQTAWSIMGGTLPRMLQFEVYAPINQQDTLRASVLKALDALEGRL